MTNEEAIVAIFTYCFIVVPLVLAVAAFSGGERRYRCPRSTPGTPARVAAHLAPTSPAQRAEETRATVSSSTRSAATSAPGAPPSSPTGSCSPPSSRRPSKPPRSLGLSYDRLHPYGVLPLPVPLRPRPAPLWALRRAHPRLSTTDREVPVCPLCLSTVSAHDSEQRGAIEMAGSDFPFSITSKFVVAGNAEHLVTIRAATAKDMQQRLLDASQIFPYAAFLSWLQEGGTQVTPEGQLVDYPPVPPDTRDVVPPAVETPTPVAATEGQATADANARAAQARVRKAEGGGNGDQDERPCCPEHGMGLPSKFQNAPPGSLYCPQQYEDGSYCKWRWAPRKPAAVAKN